VLLIKIGGGKNLNWEGIGRDITVILGDEPVIVIHGANAFRGGLACRLGHTPRTVVSPSGVPSVYSDDAAMEVFLMAYPGVVNTRLVAALRRSGVDAVGLSGVDGGLWVAKAKKAIPVRDGGKTRLLEGNLSGRVDRVNSRLLRGLLDLGFTPVISPPALSEEGEVLNTDNDHAAALTAASLSITRMVSLFEAPGLLRDPDDEASLVPRIPGRDLESFREFARGRMQRKIMGAAKALELGVRSIYWGDGRGPHPVLDALEGRGTVIE